MLDDRDRGRVGVVELGGELERPVGVGDVVVGELGSLHLARARHAGARRGRAVERSPLVGVLAVAQMRRALAADGDVPGEGLADGVAQPARDRGVVGGGAGERLGREPPAQRERGGAVVRGELGEHGVEILAVHAHRDEGVVLGRRADHRRPAHVDALHALVVARAARQHRLEGVEVDHQQVDQRDPLRRRRVEMVRRVPPGEQPAVNARMQGLHPAVHDLGEAGDIGDVGRRDSRLLERARGAARGENLHPPRGKRAGALGQPGLVGDGKQSPADGDESVRRRGHGEGPKLAGGRGPLT